MHNSSMGRKRTQFKEFPGLMAYQGRRVTTYRYRPSSGTRETINLGHDLAEAIKKWQILHDGRDLLPEAFQSIANEYFDDIVPSKSPATQKDNARELKWLLGPFGHMHIESFKPIHIRQYLDKRKAKTRGNREIALFKTIYNFALDRGYTDKPNPATGIKLNKEIGRKRYVQDSEFYKLYETAEPILKDVLDLLLYTGQRPSDILKMTRRDIWDGALWIEQGKTGTKVGITIEDNFKKVIDRIISRERTINSIYLIADKNGQRWTYHKLRGAFDRAREISGVDFQLRDLRAKNATDTNDLELAKKRLGHSTVAMTEHYVKNRKGEQCKPLKK